MSSNAHKQEKKPQKIDKHPSQTSNQHEEDIFAQQPSLTDAAQQARFDLASLSPAAVLHLQRTIGNHAVRRLQQPQEQETDQPKPNPQPFQWLGMGETEQRQGEPPVQRKRESSIKTGSVGERGSIQIREQSSAQELVVQRSGLYPDDFEDKTGQEIDEIAYGSGNPIEFSTMTSCMGIVARTGNTVTGVHLGMVSGEESSSGDSRFISEFNANTIVDEIVRIIGNPDQVVYVGYIEDWQDNFGTFYTALSQAIAPDDTKNGGGKYRAGVQDNLLHVFRGEAEIYTEQPAPPAPSFWQKYCFITTACIEAKGLPDYCYELTTLRAFRDEYMSELPYGPALIAEYYKIAPQIVARIKQQPDAAEILTGLYSRIAESVEFIQMGENEKAMQTYSAVVLELKARYLAPSLYKGDNALQTQPYTTDLQVTPDFMSQGRQLKTPDWDELVSLLGIQ